MTRHERNILYKILVWSFIGGLFCMAVLLYGSKMAWGAEIATCDSIETSLQNSQSHFIQINPRNYNFSTPYGLEFTDDFFLQKLIVNGLITNTTSTYPYYANIWASSTIIATSSPINLSTVIASTTPREFIFNTFLTNQSNLNITIGDDDHSFSTGIYLTNPFASTSCSGITETGGDSGNGFWSNFSITGTSTSTPATEGLVSLLYPQDSNNITDFTTWQVGVFNFSGLGFACVTYSRNSSTTFSTEDCTAFNNLTGFDTLSVSVGKTQSLWFSPLPASGSIWYARAVLRDVNYTLIDMGSLVTFQVHAGTSTSTQNLTNQGLTQEPSDCSVFNFGSCFSDFMQWLFIPSLDSVQQFGNISLVTKFPFSYYYSLKDVISTSISSNSDNFPTLTINGSIFGTSTIFSAQAFIDLAGQNNFDLFYNLLKWAFWIFFGYFVFVRFREIL